MASFRWILAVTATATLLAQGQQDTNKPVEAPGLTITQSVQVVVAPVVVIDRDGSYVDGLKPSQFHLLDNDKEQDIRVDVAFQPISLVLAVQCSDRVETVLPQIQKVGGLLGPMVMGDQGEVSVIAFDSRVRKMQEFTADPDKITAALKAIHIGSSQSRVIDAVEEGQRQLRSRPGNRRRVILVIGETRDKSSEARLREVVIETQLANVGVYFVDISRTVTTLMAKADPGRPDPLPPAQTPMPSNAVATPNTVMQTTGSEGGSLQFVPAMVEVFKDAKGIFQQSPAEVFTKGTGGEQLGFVRQRGLEDAIQRIGAELHSQYLISYSPNNKDEGGFHQIRVLLSDVKDAKVRTRPGYWLGAQ